MPLVVNEEGTPVSTQSMMKTFLNCPREAYYKYVLQLRPKVSSRPLETGKWMHTLLEDHYNGVDWHENHEKLSRKFSLLFDEEKEDLGDLPTNNQQLMESYLWHYGNPKFKEYRWKVHEVELKLEAELPNGHIFRGKFDMLVEDDFGLWLVDHKNQKKFPDWTYRMLDLQSPLYIWLLHQNGIPVTGFIWNYLKTAGFPKPNVLKSGKDFYAKYWESENDYVNLVRDIKAAKAKFPEFLSTEESKARARDRLNYYKSLRWNPHEPQQHPYFRREVIEKTEEMVNRSLAAAVHTSDRMHSYDFSDPDRVERNIGQCKSFMCSYKSLNLADLINGDSSLIQRRDYKTEDPLAYQDTNDQLT